MEIQASGNIQLNTTGDKTGRVDGQSRQTPAVSDELSTESSAWIEKALAQEDMGKREISQIRRELFSGRLDSPEALRLAAVNLLAEGL